MSVPALIYRAAGAPPQPGDAPGVCRTCGETGFGLPFGRWVRDTFNDHDKLRPGEIVCHACLFCFEEASPTLTARLGRDKLQRMRNYSHFVVDGAWWPLSKAEKRQMAALLRKGPQAAVIAVSGQKHILFRARPGWWQIEESSVLPFPGALWPLLEVVERLYNGGFSKEEIETGVYNQRRIQKFGLVEFMESDGLLRRQRRTRPFELALFLAQRSEESEAVSGLSREIPGGA